LAIAAVVMLLSVVFAVGRAAAGEHVLVLESYHLGLPFADNSRLGLADAFDRSGLSVQMYVEHLDATRVAQTPAYLDAFEALLRAKYTDQHLSVIVTCDDDALRFVLARRDRLFPGVPVVFLGVDATDVSASGPSAGVTGILGDQDSLAVATTVLQVLPRVREIVAIVDDTTNGRAERAALEAVAPRLPRGVTVRFLSLAGMTLAELGDALARLPGDRAVLLLNCAQDRTGESYTPAQSTPFLAARASVPLFTISDVRVGLGAIGGLVIAGSDAGRAAGDMAIRIMKGTSPGAIEITKRAPRRLLFDAAVLKRFGIPERALPPGSTIVNQPQSLLAQYRTQALAIGVVFGAVVLLAGALGLEVWRRRRVESSLRRSQTALAGILDSVPQGIFWKNRDGVYLGCNQVFATAAGASVPADVVGKTDFDVTSEDVAQAYRAEDAEVMGRNAPKRHIVEYAREAGNRRRWIETTKVPLLDETGAVYGVLGVYDDISDRRRAEEERAQLEEQLQHAVKMEAVGRLAGGVAHDFNNLLTAINGNLELANEDIHSPETVALYLAEVQKAADSAASLTRQLLAFSRKQLIEPRVTDLNALITHLQQMLARLIGEDVDLRTELAPDLGFVKVDPGQFEQALVNLVVNARDAMPDGGSLRIHTANAELDEHYCAHHPPTQPGPFVMVSVSDTGSGMTDEVKSRIFEPFFTTKPRGRGTGFGLATTFGTVTQVGGTIEVHSELGVGTTFRIYLPRVERAPAVTEPARGPARVGGHETLMLVEDNEAVRTVTVSLLERLGYTVRSASSGAEALRLAAELEHRIDLLVTDLVMPGMNGRELAERLTGRCPGLRVLFASGYTDDEIVRRGLVDEHLQFIAKPYSMEGLAAKVRLVLDRPS
jgi:PAS domain S-box-containing protein